MHITSAQFIKGVVGPDSIFSDGIPQIAFIGRSNVGKSSVINTLVNQKDLAKTSSFPGRTQQLNIFLINKSFYLVDLPGYGFARISGQSRANIEEMINWYFFDSACEQAVIVLIIDAKIGLTEDDKEMLYSLEEREKNIVIVANKIDKVKKPEYEQQMQKIKDTVGNHLVIPYSAEKRIGVGDLLRAIGQ